MNNVLRMGLLLGLLLLPAGMRAAAPAPAALLIGRFSIDVVDHVTTAEAQALRQAGAKMARYYLSWGEAQPTASSGYDWSRADQVLSALAAQNLDVQVILTGNPSWAASRP